MTDASGAYRLVLLPPGTFTVTVSLQGFAKMTFLVDVFNILNTQRIIAVD